ncbi:A-type voltage-gated potassium channel KCND2-like [Watersipora subatra]|uniref:A-type voltage-gated potassium channel KCND2-like n=1 Tax=Watersipora subatra TaxID=2589382 RepID=UPI00355B27E6
METLEDCILEDFPELGLRKEECKILIQISGQNFVSNVDTLLKYPESRLGKLVQKEPSRAKYFFESDPEIFKEVLKFYISGELHCPKNICYSDFLSHLKFWEIDTAAVSDCCAQNLDERHDLEKQFEFFNRRIKLTSANTDDKYSWSYAVWCFLTDPFGPDTKYKTCAKIWALGYFLFTLFAGTVSAVATIPGTWIPGNTSNGSIQVLQRFPELSFDMTCQEYASKWLDVIPDIFGFLNLSCSFIYLLEVWARFITCPSKHGFWRSINALDFTISLIESICYALALFGIYFVAQRPVYFSNSSACGLKVLLITLYRSWKEILLLFALLAMSVLIFGPLVYFLSLGSMNDRPSITSVPEAYWFVLVTMTTVGYGDMYPTRLPGYLIAVVVMIAGLTMTSLPIAIVGGNFAIVYKHNQERAKRQSGKKEHLTATLQNRSSTVSV